MEEKAIVRQMLDAIRALGLTIGVPLNVDGFTQGLYVGPAEWVEQFEKAGLLQGCARPGKLAS